MLEVSRIYPVPLHFHLTFAAVHLPPVVSIAIAIVTAAGLIWYWVRLSHADVPPSRRLIRRLSLMLMLLSLPTFVLALSFLDPQVQKREYVVAWTVAFSMVLLVMVTAAIDVGNTMRLMHRQAQDELRVAAKDLGDAIKNRQQRERGRSRPRHTPNGEAER